MLQRRLRDVCVTEGEDVVLVFAVEPIPQQRWTSCLEVVSDRLRRFDWKQESDDNACCGGVASHGGHLYASDMHGGRIQIFRLADGSFVRVLDHLDRPTRLFVSPERVFVICWSRCVALTHEGVALFAFDLTHPPLVGSLVVLDGELIVQHAGSITVWDAHEGCFLRGMHVNAFLDLCAWKGVLLVPRERDTVFLSLDLHERATIDRLFYSCDSSERTFAGFHSEREPHIMATHELWPPFRQ
jgi:hypothetical protein